MKTLELFCGTKSFSKVMDQEGFKTLTIDNNPRFKPDICLDLLKSDIVTLHEPIYILWASPPCTAFSVASIGKNWRDNKPISENAKLGLELLDKTIDLIKITKPTYWFIENPRGMMRTQINDLFQKHNITDFKRVTVSYCQYGDTRMKPTDIWTNLNNWNGKLCKNGSSCHISAPRGSRTGTQGLKNAVDRGVIPPQLFKEILEVIKQ
jgi:hypothetical protein